MDKNTPIQIVNMISMLMDIQAMHNDTRFLLNQILGLNCNIRELSGLTTPHFA